MRFAYANDYTEEDYRVAISEACQQAEALYEKSERFLAEADRWADRALVLEIELAELTNVRED